MTTSKQDEKTVMERVLDKAPLPKQNASFKALEGETYHAYWDRYMGLLEDCPRYVYSNSQIVNFFYDGMSPSTKRNTPIHK